MVFNCDCIEYMRSLPDKFFNLAIADPPYGAANSDMDCRGGEIRRKVQKILPTNRFGGGTWANRYKIPTMPTEGGSQGTKHAWGG